MRKCLICLFLGSFFVTFAGCGDSTTVVTTGPGAQKPPGAPEEGPEMLKTKKATPKH